MDENHETPADRLRSKNDEVEDERDLWEGGFSGKSMFGSWAAAGGITLLLIIAMVMIPLLRTNTIAFWAGVGIVLLMWLYLLGVMGYRKLGMHYQLTTQELKHREGILFRKIDRIELIDIDDVNYRQGPIQALMGVGNITIRSSDTSHPELIMYGIANIKEVSDMINSARRSERRKRGLHIETI